MKKFILSCILLSAIGLIVAIGLLVPQYIMAKKYVWEIPENKITLFMGASHIECCIDDSYLENAINLANASERYPFTYLKLQKILSDKTKIVHIVLQCAPTDLSQAADKKIFSVDNEMVSYIPLYYPYFQEEEWTEYGDYKSDIIQILLSKFYKNWALSAKKYFSQYGGYHEYGGVFDPYKTKYERLDSINFGNEVNLSYLRKIVDVCKSNNIRLTLLYCPMYNPELYYDQDYYYNVLKTKFGDVEFLDYSHLELPNEFRRDAHHLGNKKGSTYFTKVMAERLGLRYKTVE
jgi:hypothetical protein